MGKENRGPEPTGVSLPKDGRPRALVVYNSVYGNTRAIAEAIAEGLGEGARVELVAAHDRLDVDRRGLALLIVGGPTHHRGMSERLEPFVKRLCRKPLNGLRVATFDTRYGGPVLLTGSAARAAAKKLRNAGGRLEAAAASFFVKHDDPPKHAKRRRERERLEPGEIERARAWGRQLGLTIRRLPRAA